MTAVLEPTKTGSLLFVLPKSVYVTDDGLVHSHNYAMTGCFVGPLRRTAFYVPTSLHRERAWCGRCFPGARCTTRRCSVPSGRAEKCPLCIAVDLDMEQELDRRADG